MLGRFDRHLYVGLPSPTDFAEIVQVMKRKLPCCKDFELPFTEGMTGADIERLFRERALSLMMPP